MRTAFIDALTKLAERDRRVTLIVGDLGFGVVQEFARRFPRQFLNVGVAEQNMTGVAAGMALSGRVVFTYSIANFPTLRPLEQLRNDVCYHQANVVAVAVGGGLAYGSLGMSHHATEDLAMMRSLPGMTVIAPGDPAEALAATEYAAQGVGPVYLRLGRAGEPAVHTDAVDFRVGRAIKVREGGDLTIIATGGMLATAAAAADLVRRRDGTGVRVLSMHTVKPLDEAAVVAAARETAGVITLEEHSVLGGLGGAVAEALCEAELPTVRLKRLGLPSAYIAEVGCQEYLCRRYGLDVDSVARELTAASARWRGPARTAA
jgi:transketolase